MKKDIPIIKVEDIAIAIAPGAETADVWNSYIINMKGKAIQNVLINSRGYGELNGEEKTTTILRHFFEEIGPNQAVMIEPIMEQLFELTNEYWISFTHEGFMYDKKFIFVKGSVEAQYFTAIPYLDQKGVMIR
ncbi:MAG: hypothetical protein KDC34_12975 [Saprospiraceae bacterium]|nr:hypothetical protein [Saprospiraceae bacterium]